MSIPTLVVSCLASVLGGQQDEPRRVARMAPHDAASAGPLTPAQELVLRALARVLPALQPRPPSLPTAPTLAHLAPSGWPRPRKISNATVDLGLGQQARFGQSVAGIGDLDDDGVPDLAVGAPGDGYGSVTILFLTRERAVKAHARIPAPASIWVGGYGQTVCALGDLDGDGVEDIAASSPYDCQVFVHLLRADGTVRTSVDIALAVDPPYLPGALETYGDALTAPGDLDGDGVTDLIMGCGVGWDGSDPRFYTVFLRPDGSVKGYTRASSLFGCCVGGSALGDLDGDGRREVALRANALRIYFLNANGTVRTYTSITAIPAARGVTDTIDLDGNGILDWAVGDISANGNRGSYWLSGLEANGSPSAGTLRRIDGPAGRADLLEPFDAFGTSLALLGNLDGLGEPVGAPGTDDGAASSGAVWIAALR